MRVPGVMRKKRAGSVVESSPNGQNSTTTDRAVGPGLCLMWCLAPKMKTRNLEPVDVVVVGAGPVGLLAALSAVRRGLSVEVLDQSWQGFGRGYASVLHARTLRLLQELGALPALETVGKSIDRVRLFADGAEAATLPLGSPALAVPQSTLEQALLGALRTHDDQAVRPDSKGTHQLPARGLQCVRLEGRPLLAVAGGHHERIRL